MILYAKWESLVPTLAPQDTWYTGGTSIPKSSIVKIEIKDKGAPTEYKVRWDASAEKNGSIYAYLEEVETDKYKVSIVGNGYGKIFANADSSMLFYNFTNVTEIAIRFEREWKNFSQKVKRKPITAPSAMERTTSKTGFIIIETASIVPVASTL